MFESEYFQLGNLQIRYYGIIIVAAMLIAAAVAARIAQRSGKDPDHIWGGLTWAIIPAIIGARLWYILFPPYSLTVGCVDPLATTPCQDTAWFLQNFFNFQNGAIAIWSGGLHIFGAFLGGALGAYLYLSRYHNVTSRIVGLLWRPIAILIAIGLFIRWNESQADTILLLLALALVVIVLLSLIPAVRRSMSEGSEPFPANGLRIGEWLDIAAVALPLGQAIGRFANAVNQELYGIPTTLPWGIAIERAKRIEPYDNITVYPLENPTTLFHPLFLYEALWNFGAFIVLLWLYQRRSRQFNQGDFFLLYIMQYAFIRFFLEFLRADVSIVAGLNWSQVGCVVAFIVGLAAFILRRLLRSSSSTSNPALQQG